MAQILIKERNIKLSQLKLFQMIDDLSRSHFAKIREKSEVVSVSFFCRQGYDLVCKWNFGKNFFNKELKDLFNKHNSVYLNTGAGKEQEK